MTKTLQVNKQLPTAAALKAERKRDEAQALRDYEAEKVARQANMIRLRALRLAREDAEAQATIAQRPAKKTSVAIRTSVAKRAIDRSRTSS